VVQTQKKRGVDTYEFTMTHAEKEKGGGGGEVGQKKKKNKGGRISPSVLTGPSVSGGKGENPCGEHTPGGGKKKKGGCDSP